MSAACLILEACGVSVAGHAEMARKADSDVVRLTWEGHGRRDQATLDALELVGAQDVIETMASCAEMGVDFSDGFDDERMANRLRKVAKLLRQAVAILEDE